MKAIMKLTIAINLGLIFQTVFGYGSNPDSERIIDRLESFSSFAIPQKVYLHLDKTGYHAGETIWLKAYLFNGINHNLDMYQNNLYVELINAKGNAMEMRILLTENGVAKGDIKLPSDIPDGNYILRAHTDWMRNFGEDIYYNRQLYIKNTNYENVIPRGDVRRNRRFNRRMDRQSRNYDVAFFPESGNLLLGVNNRVAFKVVDGLGRGQDAEGEVIDERGDVVTRFKTDFSGIGVFDIEPRMEGAYRASVSVNGGRSDTYDLPETILEGYSMRIDQDKDELQISLNSTVYAGHPLYSEELILVGHTRGMAHYSKVVSVGDGIKELKIKNNLFPSGIAHFTVFTEDYVPVAERLVFIDREDALSFSPQLGTASEGGKDYVDLNMIVIDDKGDPVKGSFSLSVVTGEHDPDSQQDDILSYLLLDSDLKGIVESSESYLNARLDPDFSVDHLLMTHGWRRFNWDDVIELELPEITSSPDPGLTIGGRLINPANDEALYNYPVHLKVKSDHDDQFSTETGRNGIFAFTGLMYEGTFEVELSSRRLPANYPPVFDLTVREGRGYDYVPDVYTREERITRRGDDWERVRGVSDSRYASSPDRRSASSPYGTPDQTIFIDYETSTERNLYEVLRNKATGLNFEGGMITIRGVSSFVMSNEPRFMLDGSFVDRETFLRSYPRDIERIEIFRGPSAAIFGVRGGTGVIAAYSRRPGYRGLEDELQLVIQGYHEPHEFYSDYLSVLDPSVSEKISMRTVHWQPDLQSDEDGNLNVRFPLNNILEELKFNIEGAGFDGGIGFGEFSVEITN